MQFKPLQNLNLRQINTKNQKEINTAVLPVNLSAKLMHLSSCIHMLGANPGNPEYWKQLSHINTEAYVFIQDLRKELTNMQKVYRHTTPQSRQHSVRLIYSTIDKLHTLLDDRKMKFNSHQTLETLVDTNNPPVRVVVEATSSLLWNHTVIQNYDALLTDAQAYIADMSKSDKADRTNKNDGTVTDASRIVLENHMKQTLFDFHYHTEILKSKEWLRTNLLFTLNPKPYISRSEMYPDLFYRFHGEGHTRVKLQDIDVANMRKQLIYGICIDYLHKKNLSIDNYIGASKEAKLFYPK